MRRNWTIGLWAAAALSLAACSATVAGDGDDREGDVSEEAPDAYSSGIGKRLGGAYVAQGAAAPTLTLDAVKQTYSWDTGIRCVRAPCPSGETGRWAVYKASGSARYYVGLVPASRQPAQRWFRVSLDAKGGVTALTGTWGETTVFVPRRTPACTTPACVCEAAGGTLVAGEPSFVASADGKECQVPVTHCVTKDASKCPMLSPRPPGWCADGTVVQGPPSFIASADGTECQLPTTHCVTKDASKCPMLSPRPPGWCAGGTVVQGAPSFIASTDGKECQLPAAHCLTADRSKCPQL